MKVEIKLLFPDEALIFHLNSSPPWKSCYDSCLRHGSTIPRLRWPVSFWLSWLKLCVQ
jgi:hypothetical protein